jgi:hypothetical protein
MSLENLAVYATLAVSFYETIVASYNAKRLAEGEKMKRISISSLLASRSYPKDYFKSEK